MSRSIAQLIFFTGLLVVLLASVFFLVPVAQAGHCPDGAFHPGGDSFPCSSPTPSPSPTPEPSPTPSPSPCYNAFGDVITCGADPGDGTVSPGTPSSPTFGGPVTIFDPVNKSIEDIFRAILDIIMVFAIPIILFFIVWAGFLYVTAAGNATQIEKAHKALLYAVVGGLLVLGANVLLAVITNTISIFTNP